MKRSIALGVCLGLVLSIVTHSHDIFAGGRGGHSTTFDANLFGGPAKVSCLVGGSVAGVCATGYSATCNGVGDDTTAIANWRNAVKGSAALAVLYVAPGSNCRNTSGNFFWDGDLGSTNYVQNSVVWAYGAKANFTGVGGGAIPLTSGAVVACALSARISTASAGAASVTIPSGLMADGSSAAGVFPAGTNVLLAGDTLQLGGYPPSFQTFEYGIATGQSGNTITLGSPLTNAYKSTWPLFSACPSGSVDGGGPATIYKLVPSFNVNFSLYGLTNNRDDCQEVGFTGRNVVLYDVTINSGCPFIAPSGFPSGGYPTMSQNWSAFFLNIPGPVELDKENQNVSFYRSYIGGMSIQSASNTNLNIVSSRFGATIGFPVLNARVINSDLGTQTSTGVTYGQGSSLFLDGTKVVNVTDSPFTNLISYYSYSSGTFSAPLSGAASGSAISIFVPSAKYRITAYLGGPIIGHCSPTEYVFTVDDLSTDGTNFLATTRNWTSNGSPIATPAALPTPTCTGFAANVIVGYSAQTITQINSPAGSTDLTQFAAPP